jgi:hypothetical protein
MEIRVCLPSDAHGLLAEMYKGIAQGSAGDLYQALSGFQGR